MDAIRSQLVTDHRVLDDLVFRLVHDVDASSHRNLQATWCEFEHRLLSHMDVEEQILLPLLEASQRAEVERTRQEHTRIRGLICELGIAIELRTVSQSAIKQLLQVLHAHSEREDRLLYRQAGERSSAAVQHRVAASLRAAARCAHEAASRTTVNREQPGEESPRAGSD